MFTVTKKSKTLNTVWDASGNRPLCKFVKGVFETNDKAVADKLKAMGHIVTGKADNAKE